MPVSIVVDDPPLRACTSRKRSGLAPIFFIARTVRGARSDFFSYLVPLVVLHLSNGVVRDVLILRIRLDSPAGRERSGGVAGISLELGKRAAPQGPGFSGAHVASPPPAEETQAAGKLGERGGALRYKRHHAPGAEELARPKR